MLFNQILPHPGWDKIAITQLVLQDRCGVASCTFTPCLLPDGWVGTFLLLPAIDSLPASALPDTARVQPFVKLPFWESIQTFH